MDIELRTIKIIKEEIQSVPIGLFLFLLCLSREMREAILLLPLVFPCCEIKQNPACSLRCFAHVLSS